jgi:hypothetical protein
LVEMGHTFSQTSASNEAFASELSKPWYMLRMKSMTTIYHALGMS